MANGFTQTLRNRPLTCQICGREITFNDYLLLENSDTPVCRSFECGRIMRQKSTMSPTLFKSHLAFQKRLHKQSQEKQAAKKKRIDEVVSKENQENHKIFDSVMKDNPHLSKSNTHLLVIPTGPSKITSLSKERLEKYTKQLNNIIEEARNFNNASEVDYDQHRDAHEKLAQVEQKFASNPALRTTSDKLCATCKGGCCVSGKEHAYLSVFTMRQYMDNHTDLENQDILDLYLSHVCYETVDNSCINHSANGCSLPRELRSDICNAFYCDSLKSYQKKQVDKENLGFVLAIQRSNHYTSWIDPDAENDIVNVALFK